VIEWALIVSLIAFVTVGLWLVRSPRTGPTSFWVFGWIVAAAAGALLFLQAELPLARFLSYPLGTLFAGLSLAGALVFADRKVPAWLLPAALGIGTARTALVASGWLGTSYGLALVLEPPALFVAAFVVFQAARRSEPSLAQRLLAPAFLVLAVSGMAHLGWLSRGEEIPSTLMAFWLALTPPILGIQIQAAADRERWLLEHVRDRLEERVKERTSELAEANASLRQEIAERQTVEEALRGSEERYRAVTELSSDFAFAFLIDPKLGFTLEWMSEHSGRLTGLSPDEVADRGWLSLVHPDDRARAIELFQSARDGSLSEVEYRIFHRNGDLRWVHVLFDTVQTRADGSIRIVGAARDITDRKREESERRRLEQRMHEARRLESLGILTGGIAHDFNNLLTVLLGNVRLSLEDVESDSPLHPRLERMKTAAEQAATLTEQMLLYAGKLSVSLAPCDLSKEVEETLGWMGGALPEHCQIETALAPKLPALRADPPQLRQMIANLVTNAFESLEGQRGSVSVRTSQVHARAQDLTGGHGASDPSPGPYLCLEVVDTGTGMVAETQVRMLEPFFTTKFSGRGLGLAAVLGIVRSHDGVLQITSEPGRGTKARVLLPVPRIEEEVATRLPGGARPSRVLVVDDEAFVLELTREFLERAGFEVMTALGGREALDCLRERGADLGLVILDLAMPDLDGERVLRETSRMHPDLPVVVATGHSPEAATYEERLGAASGFVRKPYDPEALVEQVRRLLPG
jgi:PAS domain S-box-containing protein